MRRSDRWLPAVICLAAGYAHALSIGTPWNGEALWWLQLLALAPLAAIVHRAATPRAAALYGWVFGFAWFAGTLWWLFISMYTYGGLAAPLAVLAVAGLALVLALYYAIACGVARALATSNPLIDAVVWAAVWTLAEIGRGLWFTGLPWGAAGYAHVDGPLAAFARWIGVYGIGAVAAFAAALLAWLCTSVVRGRLRGSGAIASVAGLAAVGAMTWQLARVPQAADAGLPPLDVTLLQGNIPQDEKFQPGTGVQIALIWYAQQLAQARTPLVVAPETAIPVLPQQLPPGYWDKIRERFATGEQAALIGIPLGNMRDGYINATLGLLPGRSEPYEYAKHHLVPFGEFIPPFFRWFTEMMDIPLGDFRRGAVGQVSMALGQQRLAPNICYEDLFGEELAARFADPALAPTIFVNLSNIGWFGDSVAIDQHLSISRMRALEFHRPMIRATNTGATAIIDADGRVTHALPRLTRGVLTGTVHGQQDITPYASWASRFGLMPLWLPALAVVAAVAALRFARRRRS